MKVAIFGNAGVGKSTLFRALGIFLPLITTNCAILGLALFQTNRGYGLVQGLVFALGAGVTAAATGMISMEVFVMKHSSASRSSAG